MKVKVNVKSVPMAYIDLLMEAIEENKQNANLSMKFDIYASSHNMVVGYTIDSDSNNPNLSVQFTKEYICVIIDSGNHLVFKNIARCWQRMGNEQIRKQLETVPWKVVNHCECFSPF